MNKLKLLFILCLIPSFISGCAKQTAQSPDKICTPQTDKLQLMDSIELALNKMNFDIDKADAELNYIRTKPLTAPQFFEFWRKDTAGAFGTAESNLHTIRRIVELNIKDQDNQLCIDCTVHVQRLILPERQTVGSSQAYRMFTKSNQSLQRLKLDAQQKKGACWVEMGTDEELAGKILAQLESQIK